MKFVLKFAMAAIGNAANKGGNPCTYGSRAFITELANGYGVQLKD